METADKPRVELLSAQPVISRRSDWYDSTKYLIRCVDAWPVGGETVQLPIQQAGEVVIFSDWPISVSVNSQSTFAQPARRHAFTGDITRLYARSVNPTLWGRVVIYAGRPNLGPQFRREGPPDICPVQGGGSATFPAGTTVANPINVPVPEASGIWTEACYYVDLSITRTVNGVITGFRIEETESGTLADLYETAFETPAARVYRRFDPPIRISSAHRFVVTGTNEAVNGSAEILANLVPV